MGLKLQQCWIVITQKEGKDVCFFKVKEWAEETLSREVVLLTFRDSQVAGSGLVDRAA